MAINVSKEEVYEIYKTRLIDITTRNPAINFKMGSLNVDLYEFKEFNPIDFIYKKENSFKLSKDEFIKEKIKLFNFENVLEKNVKESELSDKYNTLVKKLSKLCQKNNLIQKERGKKVLYIAFHFISGIIQNEKKINMYAPIYLIPIDIIFNRNNFEIKKIDEEIIINRSFLIGLAKSYKIKIPNMEYEKNDLSKEDINDFITLLQTTNLDFINNNEFTKFPETKDKFYDPIKFNIYNHAVITCLETTNDIYNDYERINNDTNGIIDTLLDETYLPEKNNDEYEHEFYKLNFNERNIKLITQLDVSQELAVYMAKNTKNLVIYGPPGTGKSETILNIIADNVSRRKKVLVVSEKKAAINVLYNRLKDLQTLAIMIDNSSYKLNDLKDNIQKNFDCFIKRNTNDLNSIEKIEESIKYFEEIYMLLETKYYGKRISDWYKLSPYRLNEEEEDLIFKINKNNKIKNLFDVNYDDFYSFAKNVGNKQLIKDYLFINNDIKKYNMMKYLYENDINITSLKQSIKVLIESYKNIQNEIKEVNHSKLIIENAYEKVKQEMNDIKLFQQKINKIENEINEIEQKIKTISIKIKDKYDFLTYIKKNKEQIIDNFSNIVDLQINLKQLTISLYKENDLIGEIIASKAKQLNIVTEEKNLYETKKAKYEQLLKSFFNHFNKNKIEYFENEYREQKIKLDKENSILNDLVCNEKEKKQYINKIKNEIFNTIITIIEKTNNILSSYNNIKEIIVFKEYERTKLLDLKTNMEKFINHTNMETICANVIENLYSFYIDSDLLNNFVFEIETYIEKEQSNKKELSNIMLEATKEIENLENNITNEIKNIQNKKMIIEDIMSEIIPLSQNRFNIIPNISYIDNFDLSLKNINIQEKQLYEIIEKQQSEYKELNKIISISNLSYDELLIPSSNYYLEKIIAEYLEYRDLIRKIYTTNKNIIYLYDFLNENNYIQNDNIETSLIHIYENIRLLEIDDIYGNDLYKINNFEKLKEQYKDNETKYLTANVFEIINNYETYINNYTNETKDNIIKQKSLSKELGKRRSTYKIRQFINEYFDLLLNYFPIMLITPDALSKYFPTIKECFDIVIFDEASQLLEENAIPAIYRAKKIVVVGDDKQLQPSSFFKTQYDLESEIKMIKGESIEDCELDFTINSALTEKSLLDVTKPRFNSVWLIYHYRSKYAELINFSNLVFYNGNLKLAPSITKNSQNKCIERIRVYDAINENKQNKKEANETIKILYQILKEKDPNDTVGIITFNENQKELIIDLIEKNKVDNIEFSKLYNFESNRNENYEDKSIFVKNIENVQGDERDIIVFSIGYAKNQNGKLNAQFGPLSQMGGENRLNVAITRAKKKIYIITSFEPEELDVEDTKNDGPKIFKSYLEYAKYISMQRFDEANNVLNSYKKYTRTIEDEDFDSPFEQQVYTELTNIGYNVDTQIGCYGFRIDLAIFDEQTKKYILGIECDGATYHSGKDARQRDIQRQAFLETHGWKIHRIWSTNWFKNKNYELKKIVDMINSLKERKEQ